MAWAFIKMLLALGGVCFVLIFLARVLKRNGVGKGNIPSHSGIRLLTTQWIAPHKYISLVEIAGEVFALGISETQINLLTRIENRDFIERLSEKGSMRTDPLPLFPYLPIRYRAPKIGLLRRLYGR